jgi:hypothetical protein
MEIGADDVSRL